MLATLCALIAVASLSWGYRIRRWIAAVLVGLAFLSVVVAEIVPHVFGDEADDWRTSLSWGGLSRSWIVTVIGVGYLSHSRAEKAARAQAGLARQRPRRHPAAGVVRVDGDHEPARDRHARVVDDFRPSRRRTCSSGRIALHGRRRIGGRGGNAPVALTPPDFYVRFAVTLLVTLVVVLAIAAIVAVAAFRRFPKFSVPHLSFPEGTSKPRAKQDENLLGIEDIVGVRRALRRETEVLRNSSRSPQTAHARSRQRASSPGSRTAASHCSRHWRSSTALALVPLTVPWIAEQIADWNMWPGVTSVAGWALGLLAIAAATYVITDAVTATDRPLGLVWDIFCFFPRAGHPFTPPCYAERSVPELGGASRSGWRPRRRRIDHVIISAHSMGAPIAIATIFSIWAGKDSSDQPGAEADVVRRGRDSGAGADRPDRAAHLRGAAPRVLRAVLPGGVRPEGARRAGHPAPAPRQPRPVGGTGARGMGPRRRQAAAGSLGAREADHRAGRTMPPGTAEAKHPGAPDPRRGPRWRPRRRRATGAGGTFWRRTDYLGFPAAGYKSGGNLIDHGASERAPREYVWMIARHNDYLGTLQYDEAIDELLAAWKAKASVGSGGLPAGRGGVRRSSFRPRTARAS